MKDKTIQQHYLVGYFTPQKQPVLCEVSHEALEEMLAFTEFSIEPTLIKFEGIGEDLGKIVAKKLVYPYHYLKALAIVNKDVTLRLNLFLNDTNVVFEDTYGFEPSVMTAIIQRIEEMGFRYE